MEEKILNLQERIKSRNSENEVHEYIPRVFFSKVGELYEFIYYGEGYDDSAEPISEFDEDVGMYGFSATQEFLIENADRFRSIKFEGEDTGANGTKEWNFSRLANANVVFENLKDFSVQLMDVGDHNHVIIGEEDFKEDGMIAKLVSKMPNLEFLQMPSAPNKDFFELPNLKIRALVIQAGYGHQNFIENLATSNNLPNLGCLDFSNPYDYNSGADITSFESYKKLFSSKIFSQRLHFKLRENSLEKLELLELKKLADIQFLHIPTELGEYIEDRLSRYSFDVDEK